MGHAQGRQANAGGVLAALMPLIGGIPILLLTVAVGVLVTAVLWASGQMEASELP